MTSITNYVLNDALPRDSAGQRFLAFPDTNSSSLGFTLPRAIGASIKVSGQAMQSAHLGIGTHTQMSPVNNRDVGVVSMGITNPSSISNFYDDELAYMGGITRHRELYAAPRPSIASMITTGSRNTVIATDATFYGIVFSTDGAAAGDTIRVKDGVANKFGVVLNNSRENGTINIGPRGSRFASGIVIDKSHSGNMSITVLFLGSQ